MMKYNIQDIFREYGPEYIKTHKLSKEQWKVYNAIMRCKTRYAWNTYNYLQRMWRNTYCIKQL